MNAGEKLGRYAEGWTKGDAEIILSAASDSFTFDDPNAGVITRENFAEYLAGLRDVVAAARGGEVGEIFIELTEVLTQETDGGLAASCWWAFPGTDIQGGGLIKVGSDGVESERITYYTKLPE